MTIYIVFKYHRYEEAQIVAVFDSEEKAYDYMYDNEPVDSSDCSLEVETFQVQ
jgi:hypothetical protein